MLRYIIKVLIVFISLFILFILISFIYKKYKFKKLSIITYQVIDSTLDKSFKQDVENIIDNSYWNKKIKLVKTDSKPIITIYLKSDKFMDKYHQNKQEYYENGEPIRFSITYQNQNTKPVIFINYNNWNGVPQSNLSISQYKKYIINHEIGHALGYNHIKCDSSTLIDGRCPIMYQSTRGCGKYPCGYEVKKEDFNSPLISKSYNYTRI